VQADVADAAGMEAAVAEHRPDVIVHLAAQVGVRRW
jgi:nucleoside-diphosphate-sugar epimerase